MNSMTGSKGPTGSLKGNRTGDRIPEGYSKGQLQQFTPEQMQLFQQLFSHLGPDSYLSRLAGGDESIFNQIEAPAMKQFNSLQGNLASRFSGMGMGARKSSGFQNTANQAGADFASQLQSQRQGLQQQAIRDLLGMSNQLLNQRPQEKFLSQDQQSPWGDIAGRFAGAIPGAAVGFLTGGPAGAAVGGASGFFNSGNQSLMNQASRTY